MTGGADHSPGSLRDSFVQRTKALGCIQIIPTAITAFSCTLAFPNPTYITHLQPRQMAAAQP